MRGPLIGIAGTNASGKDTVGQLLVDEYSFNFISMTDILRTEAAKRGLKPSREVLRTISTEWRRQSRNLGILIVKAVKAHELDTKNYKGLALASLRNSGEADTIHSSGGLVLWIDADPKIRYERIRSSDRGRAEEDNKTFAEFVAEEKAEMTHTGDDATLDLLGVKDKADINVVNEASLEHLRHNIRKVVSPYLSRFSL